MFVFLKKILLCQVLIATSQGLNLVIKMQLKHSHFNSYLNEPHSMGKYGSILPAHSLPEHDSFRPMHQSPLPNLTRKFIHKKPSSPPGSSTISIGTMAGPATTGTNSGAGSPAETDGAEGEEAAMS
jgi:hypothetical protein